ncbi:MAG: VIT1/CCC1 transporter family protein [Cytophagales bacterium]
METKVHGDDKIGIFPKTFMGSFVYGGIDGAVTTFAVVSGATGANMDVSVILVLGFANLIADGFSMSVGSYFSAKTEQENYQKLYAQEEWEIENMRETEIQEIREIYQKKGFEGDLLDKVVEVICNDKKVWIETMMTEELNTFKDHKTPFQSGLATFLSFNFIGFIPLAIYVFGGFFHLQTAELFFISCFSTLLALGSVGWIKSLVTGQNKWKSVMETVFLGSVAALLAYVAGNFLEKLLS